jgi:hypothetical protein
MNKRSILRCFLSRCTIWIMDSTIEICQRTYFYANISVSCDFFLFSSLLPFLLARKKLWTRKKLFYFNEGIWTFLQPGFSPMNHPGALSFQTRQWAVTLKCVSLPVLFRAVVSFNVGSLLPSGAIRLTRVIVGNTLFHYWWRLLIVSVL